jgi:uncharacterized membrane protein YoaK (UPF0700 family)
MDTIAPEALPSAMLLAATGGLLDAIVYLNHGHVFANNMTGNLIFLGIAVLAHDADSVIPHIVPICGFFLGVLTSKHLRTGLGMRCAPIALGLEIVTIFALGWLSSGVPSMIFTGVIAYVAAVQVASFRHVGTFVYNSTFMTGNLRDVAEGLYENLAPSSRPETRSEGRAKTVDFGLIVLCFLLGAVVGAWAAPRFGNHSLWLAEPLLIAVAVPTFRHRS